MVTTTLPTLDGFHGVLPYAYHTRCVGYPGQNTLIGKSCYLLHTRVNVIIHVTDRAQYQSVIRDRLRQGLETAAALCVQRGHRAVELEHWHVIPIEHSNRATSPHK